MVYKVTFTSTAKNDLNQIRAYIERDNPKRALEWVQLLRGHADSLDEFPLRGREYGTGFRMLVVNNGYQVYYRVDEDSREVIIHHFISPYQNYK